MASALCLGLLLMTVSSIEAQATSSPFTSGERSDVRFYLPDLPFDSSLTNPASIGYIGIRSQVASSLSSIGLELTDFDLKDGGGCFEVYVQWAGNDIQALEKAGLMTDAGLDLNLPAFGLTVVTVSFEGCQKSLSTTSIPHGTVLPNPTNSDELTKVNVFLSGLAYTSELEDPKSESSVSIKTWMQSLLNATGGVIEDIAFEGGNDCLHMMLYIRGGDVGAQTVLLTEYTRTGLEFFEKKLNVSLMECPATGSNQSDHQLLLRLYVSGLPWQKGYSDHKTADYEMVEMALTAAFITLGGRLLDLEIMQSGDCVLLLTQWRLVIMDETNMNLVQRVVERGLKMKDRVFKMNSDHCPMSNVTFCNFFTEQPCGDNGECVGNSPYSRELEMCSCDAGFGGLFCENSKPDNISECERMRRFSLFIHNQITGHEQQPKSMNTTMTEILAKLMQKQYFVPYCYPPSNGSRENYYSSCEYDATKGQKLRCHCLNGNGSPNYDWDYIAEDDCRAHGKYLAYIRGEMFIHNLSWSNDLLEESELVTSFKSQIEKHMAPAGGYLSELKFSPWGISGCVQVKMVYRAESSFQGRMLLYSLPGSSLMVKDENKSLSLFPCQENIDVNACPEPLPGSLGICLYECGDSDPCTDGLTCCNNACGQGICKELGFLQKMKVDVTLGTEFKAEYERENSTEYTSLRDNVINSINLLIAASGIDGFKSVKVLGFKRAEDIVRGRRRKRRQAPEFAYIHILLEFQFTEEIPVEQLMGVREHLKENGIAFDGKNFEVLNIRLGKEGQCGGVECFYESICVERIGGQEQCACPNGRAGSNCQLQVCQRPDGTSMCQNGAPCRYDEARHEYRCHCETGFHGKYCETNVCGLFKPDACNGGFCVGDIKAMNVCNCTSGKGGMFCQYNVQPNYNPTYCERHHAFASYVVGVLNGSNSGSELSGNVTQLFPFFNATRDILLLPTCRYDNLNSRGEYHYFCGFDTNTGLRSTKQDCLCANGDGSPNYWTFYNGQCVVYVAERQKPCDRRPCANGGVCHNMPNNDFSCSCSSGFHGRTCEIHSRDQCPHGGPPLYHDAGIWTCGDERPCPVGFQCHGDSFNGSCCFQPDFVCKFDLCQNNASCMGDLHSAQICICPEGKTGLFCDREDDGVKLTHCQKEQQLTNWLLNLLGTGLTPKQTNVNDFRQILTHIGITYLPKDMCDDEGAFKTKVESVSVWNDKDVKDLCFDEHGNYDPLCKDEICDSVEPLGICKNGGRCIGDISHAFCDCTGTGYHGPRCERPGVENRTECMQVRDFIQFALRVANGSEHIIPGYNLSEVVRNLFDMTQIPLVFEPYCDDYGRYAYKGCAHFLPALNTKLCYCTDEDLERIGEEMSIVEPPERCSMGPDQCPHEWGPECERPDWWCTHEMKCNRGEEKCYFAIECDEEECSKTPKISCVPVELNLPCEPQPCKHDKYKMCPPCGEEASCFHITRAEIDMDDGNDDDEDKDDGDDNDSEEKHAGGGKGDDDNDSGEKSLSWMKLTKGQNYICECPSGRSGPRCEVHEDICRSVPSQLCPHGCIGDLENGVLCRCPEGYAGLTCTKYARTPCEVKQAFFGDSLNILRGHFTVPGYEISELQKLVQFLVYLVGGDTIPETNCTENGFYEKVQCYINVYNLDEKYCSCVNIRGDYVASNILPRIGYETPCTGPIDVRGLVGLCFRQDLQLCQNGGLCVFDLYEGNICDCPAGFGGQLCEKPGHDEASSFCEFMLDAYHYSHDFMVGNATMDNHVAMHVFEIMSAFIDLKTNHTTNGHRREYVGLKYQCYPDGTFKHYACDHDLVTDEQIACYCLGNNGPLMGTEASGPEQLNCSDSRDLACHELDACPYLECEHGHRHNLQYCPICECRHPCEGYKCHRGERCVVEDYDCDKHDDEKCSKPVCVPMHKPGVCPGHKPEHIRSIQDRMMANSSIYGDDTCQVKCHDDADCEGSKKCCGLCGNMCVEPEESDDCTHQYDIMMEYLEFIRDSRNLTLYPSTPRSLIKTVDQAAEMKQIWVPSCRHSNYVPVQCTYNVSALLMGSHMTTECFCVDRLGHRIKGSVGHEGNESSCDVKPFSCPILHPSTDEDAMDECTEDMDCVKGSKCCHDGFHHICSEPVPEPADDYVIDAIMTNVCVQSPDICPTGPCMSKWETDGKVCECGASSSKTGPFCEISVSNEMPKPRTACERKRLTAYMYWHSFEKLMTTDTDRQNYSTMDHVVEFAIESLLKAIPEDEHEKIPILIYSCDEDGNYEPVQCDLGMYTANGLECFCVDEEGKELPGTRKPYGEPLSFCRKQQMCDVGHAFHGTNDDLVMCDKDNQCPYGYSCSRGVYGNLYCCPNEEEKSDICNHPVDIGFECKNSIAAVKYYYRNDTDSCESFPFKGCGGNRNRFESMDDCTRRCKHKTHFGSCPSTQFKVAKNTSCNENQCETDNDCPSDRLKCCDSTCGKRCIPAIDESPAEGHCPIGLGLPKSEPETCGYSAQCGVGYKCYFSDEDASVIDRTGYCCLDHENINYCEMKPLMMGNMKEDSTEDKDDDDKDDDGMSERGMPNVPCKRLRPRYYYNHEHSQCEMYHGCEEDFNTFDTREDCCKTCSAERRCKEGRCPSPSSDVSVSCTDECSTDYDCQGQKICCNTGCSLSCVSPHDERNSTCFADQREAKKARALNQRGNTCNAVYIPMCEENGKYARQQCQSSLGICWCVTPQGNYISPSLTRGVASCHHYSEVDVNSADLNPESVHDVDFQVCPQDEQIHCCSESLCERRCHAHPQAMCRINPCGGCRAEHFDADNNIVNCEEGLTYCQLELQDALRVINSRSITANMEREESEYEEEEERRREMAEQTSNDWGSTIHTGIPLKCQKAPETGNCKGFLRRWFYNPETRKCSMFIWGMCGGNSNRFRTPKECYDECDPPSNPCSAIRCGTPYTECTLTYDEDCYSHEDACQLEATCTEPESLNLVNGVFIPRCFSSGEYNNKQCHGGFCWCVDDVGEYAGGLSSTYYYGDLQCTASGPTGNSVINVPDCPAGSYTQKPQHECLKACSDKVCPGYPRAECVVDLCSESCATVFKDEYGSTVTCGEDECKAFSLDTEDREHCSGGVLCDGENVKNCPNTVCDNAKERLCPQNPCAVCMVDSCTCEPYFIDAISSEQLDPDSSDCKYLRKGSCTVQTCKLMLDNTPADQLPQCSTSGSFRARQCRGSFCYCVEADGNFVRNVSANGNCDEIDEIAKIDLKLAFNGDFDLLSRLGKLSLVKEAVRNELIYEMGVPEANIYSISEPYKSSVAVDVVIQENKDDPNNGNLDLISNSLSQKLQSGFDIEVDGQKLGLLKDESTLVPTTGSLIDDSDDDDDDDDGLSDKEIIIIAACGGGVAFLILMIIICCCCCRKKKEPEVVDDTYDHIRERRQSDKNIYDNPPTMYNNKSFEAEGHYMDIQDSERYMKVRL